MIFKMNKIKRQPSLKQGVYNIVKSIPWGKTFSYKDVAEMVGRPKAWRAIGNILNKNNEPSIPCHRVIRSDGSLGGYKDGTKKKKEILEKEKNENDPV